MYNMAFSINDVVGRDLLSSKELEEALYKNYEEMSNEEAEKKTNERWTY